MNAAIKLSSPATREFWEISVLFEDEHLLALDKPARLLTSPDANNVARPSLTELLHVGIAQKKPWAGERNLDYLNNTHFLDFDASGVLLLAKDNPTFITITNLFSSARAQTKYVALVHGEPLENQFEVNAGLSPHPVKLGVMRIDPQGGKQAKTQFEVLENYSRHGYGLLKCKPIVEHIHQVRVHASHVGLKIVADELYGGKPLWLSRLKQDYRLKPGREERALLSRVALHAEELTLPHPVTNQILTIKSDWPKDLKVAVKYLCQFAK